MRPDSFTLRANDCLSQHVPILEADLHARELRGMKLDSQTTYVAVVAPTPDRQFLGLVALKDGLDLGGEVKNLGELAADCPTISIERETPIETVRRVLADTGQSAAAVVDDAGRYLGAVTTEELERRRADAQLLVTQLTSHLTHVSTDRAVEAIIWIDSEDRILYANDSASRMTGLTREELVGKRTLDIKVQPPAEDWIALWEKVKRHGTLAFETKLRAKDGRVFDSEVTASHIHHAGREFVCATMRDITHRRQLETELQLAHDRLDIAVKASNVGVWEFEPVNRKVYFSREWKSQLGFAAHEVENGFVEWEKRLHPDDRQQTLRCLERYLADPSTPYEVEFRMRHKEGSWRWIYSRGELITNVDGGPARMFGCHLDVTELKQSAERAQASEAFLLAGLDALSSSKVIVDQTGRICFLNRAWREYARCNQGDESTVAEGVNYLHICDQARSMHSDAGIIADTLRSVLAGGSDPPPLEYACHSPSQQRWFQALIHGFKVGEKRFAIITHQDVTPVHLAVEQQSLADRREALATVSAGIAHEYNSSLLAAAMYLHEVHAADAESAAAVRKAVQIIQQTQSLSSSLLELFAGAEKFEQPILTLATWLPGCIGRLAEVLPGSVSVDVATLSGSQSVRADPLALEQVLRILLGNAMDATGGKGKINVTATLSQDHTAEEPSIQIRVIDDGPGIPVADRARVFEPFFTTHSRVRRSGLGLTIASRLVEQAGGRLFFEPNSPKGSTFVVQLRTADEEEA